MKGRLITDTTNFLSIDYGDIIPLGDKRYIIKGHEHERRFGMDDPKFWVKKAVDPDTGEKKLIKLSYLESFETQIGGVTVKRFRNPEKEGKILNLVRGHPYFMQGEVFEDAKGNNVRVLDVVTGQSFLAYIDSIRMDYKAYFKTRLPAILRNLVRIFEAIRFLHINGFRHGDIRNDHIIIERETGNYVWIDFDYDYEASENPFGLDIFGLGNILVYAIGKGFHTIHFIENDRSFYGDLIDRIDPKDFSILNRERFINLQKLFPDIPVMLNNILMHFSRGSEVYYEFVEELVEDLNRCLYALTEVWGVS